MASRQHSRAGSRVPSRAHSRAPSMGQPGPMPMVVDYPPDDRAPSAGPIIMELPEVVPPPIYIDVPAVRPGPVAPGLSGGRGMFKRLIVACDGTWLNSDAKMINGMIPIPSNVTRISRAIKAISQDGIPQIVNYQLGIGSQGSTVQRLVNGTTGEGLGDTIREAYSFIANNYHPGDEIFLIGFSRGAFTARSIAGLISEIGLLTKKGLNSLPEVHADVQHRRDPKYVPKNPNVPFPNKPPASSPRYKDELERRGLTRLGVQIKVVAVWDTVGSLGAPRVGFLQKVGLQPAQSKEMTFYDTKLSNCIENAFQALALDEHRTSFAPAVWEKPEGNKTTLRQVWFPGVHSNVGGGYDDQQLANITLAWMMSQLEPFLDMREGFLWEMDEENEKWYRRDGQSIRPWGFGEIVESNTGVFAIGGGTYRTPGHYNAVDPHTGRCTTRPLRQTNEYIHPSVRARMKLGGPGVADKGTYDCRPLTDNYKLVVNYNNNNGSPKGHDDDGDTGLDVFWKLRWKDEGAVRILPEAPLWRLERELCKRDARTWDFVRKPPASGRREEKRRPRQRASSVEEFSEKREMGRKGRPTDVMSLQGSPRPRHRGFDDERHDRSPRSTHRGRYIDSYIDEKRGHRARARSMDRETVGSERSSVLRENMPHRRARDKTWWDGESERGGGGGGGGGPRAARRLTEILMSPDQRMRSPPPPPMDPRRSSVVSSRV